MSAWEGRMTMESVLFIRLEIAVEKLAPYAARCVDEDELPRFLAHTLEVEFSSAALSQTFQHVVDAAEEKRAYSLGACMQKVPSS